MLNPASRIVALLGGPQTTAELAGVHVSRVFRWTYPKARGGTGGLVPAQHQQRLLDCARARGIALEPADFFLRGPDAAADGAIAPQAPARDSEQPEIECAAAAESRPVESRPVGSGPVGSGPAESGPVGSGLAASEAAADGKGAA